MTSKQDKKRAREQLIIAKTCDLIRDNGFFNLRMSDVAKAAEISIGTLYVHFESKEDLIFGIANYICSLHGRLFTIIEETFKDGTERIIAIILVQKLINDKLGEIDDVEYIAAFPSVWQRASQHCVEQHGRDSFEIGTKVRRIFAEAHDQGAIHCPSPVGIEKPNSIGISTWGLSMGMNMIFNSSYISQNTSLTDSEKNKLTYEAIEALLIGYGSKRDDLTDTCAAIRQQLIQLGKDAEIL